MASPTNIPETDFTAETVPLMPGVPRREVCGAYISDGIVSYRCSLGIGHDSVPAEDPEPHYTGSVYRVVQAWQAWAKREWDRRKEAETNPTYSDPTPEEIEPVVCADGFVGCEVTFPHTHPTVGGEVPPDAEPSIVVVQSNAMTEDTAFDPEVHLDETQEPIEDFIDRVEERLRTRPEDQPLPDGDESLPDDQSLLIADIEARRQVGIQRYGQGHRPFNGRNTVQDMYEEQLDFLVYLRSIVRMRDALRDDLILAVRAALLKADEERIDAISEIAVDRIMGWVFAQLVDEGVVE